MSEINWLEPTGRTQSKEDVSIAIYSDGKDKQGNERKSTHITFRNDSYLKITHGDFLSVGIDAGNKRICFKDGVISGFKLSKTGNHKYVRIPSLLTDYIGDYALQMAGTGDYFFVKKEG